MTEGPISQSAPESPLSRPQGLYTDLVELAGLGVWIFNDKGNTSYVNRSMAEMLGYTKEEMESQPVSAFADEDAIGQAADYFQRRRQGVAESHEFKLRHRDGSDFWVYVTSKPIFDRAGVFHGALTMMMDINERKQAEQERDRNQAQLRAVLDAAKDQIFIKGADGRYLMANLAVGESAGRPVEDFLGHHYAEFFPPELAASIAERDAQVLGGGETVTMEATIGRGDRERTFQTTKTPYRDETGKIVGILGITRDITKRKQAEDRLRRSEERYRGILETMQEGYYEVDLNGTVMLANDALARFFGFERREELESRDLRPFLSAASFDRVLEGFRKVYDTGEPAPMLDLEAVDSRGRQRWATVSIAPMLDDAGAIVGFRGVARDVTERVRAQEALRQSEARYRAIVENIQEGYYEVDLRGRLIFCNEAFLKIYRLSREEAIGMDYREYIGEERAEAVFEVFSEVYRTGLPVERFAQEVRCRDGAERTMEVSIDLIRDAAGAPIGFRGVVRDVTEAMLTARALAESEKRFHAVFDNAMEGIIVVNDEMRVVDVNPAGCRLHAVTRDELLGRRMTDFLQPEHVPAIEKMFQKLLRQGAFRATGPARRADGAIREMELSSKAHFLPGLHLSLMRDITDRVRDERLLRAEVEVLEMIAGMRSLDEVLARLAQMVEDVSGGLGCGIFMLNAERDHLCLRASSQGVGGSPEEEAMCVPVGERSGSCGAAVQSGHPEASEDLAADPRWEGIREPLLRQGYRGSFSTPILSGEGVVLGTACMLFPETRGPNEWEAKFAEVATHLARIAIEKNAAEERLRASEARFRAVTEKSADGICLVGADGKVLYASLAFERVLGYKPEEIVGRYAQKRLHPEDAERTIAAGRQIVQSPGASVTIEFRTQHRNGSWRWLEVTITNLLHEPSVRAGVINFRDITQRKLAEQALRASEERFSHAFNLSPCGISIVTADGGRILQVNDTWVKQSGYFQAELFGRPARDFSMWADSTQYHEFKRLLQKQGYVREFIAKYRIRSGEVRTALVSAEMIELDGERCILTAAMDLTQRLRAEEALRATEKRFSTAFNVGPHPMCIIALENPHFVSVNEAMVRTLGWREDEIVGHTSLDIDLWVDPKDRGRLFSRLLADGRVDEYEAALRMRDGGIRRFLISGRVFEIAGKGYGVAIATDVTERRQAEARLRASETRFARAFNASPIPISISTLEERRYINVNDAWLRVMGYAREEVVGRTLDELDLLVAPVDKPALIGAIRGQGTAISWEIELRVRDGGFRTFLTAVDILEFGGEEVLLVASLDITDRKRAEDELRESRERYKALFEHSFAGICRSTRDGRILECNEAMAKMFGYDSPEELRQVGAWDLHFDAADRDAALREINARGRLQNFERLMRKKDGTPIWTLSNATLLEQGPSQEPVLEGVILDITERKVAEEELSRSREQLRAISARVEVVREEERKAIAREIHDELGQLMTGLKLDIAWIDKRVRVTTDENLREQLRPKMIEMASLLETTIQTVRTIASQLRPGALDALGLVAAIQWQAKEHAQRLGIRFEMQLCREPQGLSIERATAIFRIFQEIMTNVARHASASLVRIELSEADRWLTLCVSDDGVGIPPGKIQDPTSLGLLGMRERVLLFGGELSIEPRPESGTRVCVRLPLG